MGSRAWEKLEFKRMQTYRRLQKSLYMLITCLSMSDIKAYIFASYGISTSHLGVDAPTEKQLSLGIGEEVT